MLHATALENTPEARALADFWNEMHSVAARLSGLHVAVVVEGPVETAGTPLGQVCIAWPDGSGRLVYTRVTEHALLQLAPGLRVRHVVLADRDVSPPVEAALRGFGFVRELPGQTTGYWLREGQVPDTKPGYRPTGAVLASPREPDRFLVLVEVDHAWYPMTEAASHHYEPTEAMQSGDARVFAEDTGPWPNAHTFEFDQFLTPESLMAYGPDVVRRAKPGQRFVQVRAVGGSRRPR